jgi:hypothetical protein
MIVSGVDRIPLINEHMLGIERAILVEKAKEVLNERGLGEGWSDDPSFNF